DTNGNIFTDHSIHRMLEREGYHRVQHEGFTNLEWYDAPDDVIANVIWKAITGQKLPEHKSNQKIILRKEQKAASAMARKLYNKAIKNQTIGQAVWNCKMS